MKKIFLLLMLFSPFLASALWMDYPSIMNNGTMFINGGIGFGKGLEEPMLCPPLTASIDFALPVAGFPLTLGIISGYSSEKSSDLKLDNWLIAGRIAYHLGIFPVKRLDPYLVLTLGGIASKQNDDTHGYFWPGIHAGARYFFLPYLGAFAELGFDQVQNISFGLTFKL